ncbi:MAG: enoyl-CoA hydratase/isomerase family protein [Burkholderiales bacterium]|nr:enoyl-CoA hydratase/isomerase family protein [Burkholderiales bacterium]
MTTLSVRTVPRGRRTIAELRLSSADGLNRLGSGLVRALDDALRGAAADETVSAVILLAEGKSFCAGADVAELRALGEAGFRRFMTDILALYRRMALEGPPILARVQGSAMGGGAALALFCDLVIAADSSSFAFPEAKLGLAGGGYLLPRIMTWQQAAETCYPARRYSAPELQALGLVNAVYPEDRLDAGCEDWLARVIAQSPAALRASKASLAGGISADLAAAMARHVDIQVKAYLGSSLAPGAREDGA